MKQGGTGTDISSKPENDIKITPKIEIGYLTAMAGLCLLIVISTFYLTDFRSLFNVSTYVYILHYN